MRYFKLVLPQVIVAAICARSALFYFEVAFGFGDAGVQIPVEWKIALDAIVGVIVLMGFGLGFASRRFPWLVPLMVPPMIWTFTLRPFQRDLYSVDLRLGAYTDLLFLLGAVVAVALSHWRGQKAAT